MKSSQPITLNSLFGAFAILLAGAVLSFCAFAVENVMLTRCRLRNVRRTQREKALIQRQYTNVRHGLTRASTTEKITKMVAAIEIDITS